MGEVLERESGEMDQRDGENDIEIEGVWGDWREMEGNGSDFSDKDTAMRDPLLVRKRLNSTSQIAIVGASVCPIESLDYE